MQRAARQLVHDNELRLEAYRLSGFAKPFPPHFHAHYSIGLLEAGMRTLDIDGARVLLEPGDIMVCAPNAAHSCAQESDELLDYRGLSIERDDVQAALLQNDAESPARPGAHGGQSPCLRSGVVRDEPSRRAYRALHDAVMQRDEQRVRKAALARLLALVGSNLQPFPTADSACEQSRIVKDCRRYLEGHLAEKTTIADLCRIAGASESTLSRAFIREEGITPYRYLESMRIEAARQLLKRGETPANTALACGFSDQSHFTNRFASLTGLTPASYRLIYRQPAREAQETSRSQRVEGRGDAR